MKKISIIFCLLFSTLVFAQPKDEVTEWKYGISAQKPMIGQVVEILLKVKIKKDWHIYGSDFDPNCGPQVTTLSLHKSEGAETQGGLLSVNSERFLDEAFECHVTKFKQEGLYKQKLKITGNKVSLFGTIAYQVCTDGTCIPYERDFTLQFDAKGKASISESTQTIKPANPTDTIKLAATTKSSVVKKELFAERKPGFDDIEIIHYNNGQPTNSKEQSFADLLLFAGIAFLSGLVALLTPCVFPMIPMTVSFFTNSSRTRAESVSKALLYGFCIVAIYVLFGTVIAVFNGPDFANWLATNWVPNLLFFSIFIFFALSFLGLFEITLPSSFVNKVDSQADKGGIIGVFFMAFTLVLVSFSCTGPIVGSILVEAAGGQVLKPIFGMLGFSMAFAVPFTLFAIFPSWLNGLPKSGGWLNSVKVVLGLLELALALKFLSLADQAYHWHILDREVFLSLWIAIFAVMFIYLIGKIEFPHDSKMQKLGVPRAIVAIITLSFLVYLIPGMWGAPLKVLSGLLPPSSTQDFDTYSKHGNSETTLCDNNPMYSESLHLPHGLEGYYDLREAINCAVTQNKPIFLDFTGHGCANCRDMEARVWSDPSILPLLKKEVVMLALYGDDKKLTIPENEQYTNSFGKQITTLGKQASDLMYSKFQQQAQPYYVLLAVDVESSKNGKIVLRELQPAQGYDLNIGNFKQFIGNGLKAR